MNIGFLVWQLLNMSMLIAIVVLMVRAIQVLRRQDIPLVDYWWWVLLVLCMPFIGSIIVFNHFDKPRTN